MISSRGSYPQDRQLSLAGFDLKPQQQIYCLFFAIFPDANAAARMWPLAQVLRAEHRLRGKPLAMARFHVTLLALGNFGALSKAYVAKAAEAAASISLAPFEVAFDRVASFQRTSGSRPLVLRGGAGLHELVVLRRELGMATKGVLHGGKTQGSYTPHVTLLYADRCVAEQAIETIGWTVHEFVLVCSLVGQTRHIVLGRWPLMG